MNVIPINSVACPVCGTRFNARTSYAGNPLRGWRLYCSKNCARIAHTNADTNVPARRRARGAALMILSRRHQEEFEQIYRGELLRRQLQPRKRVNDE